IDRPDEFFDLIKIFNKYPVEELTIHPRIQKDMYKNKPNMDIFKYAFEQSKNPICYNGDISTLKHYWKFSEEFPEVGSIMLGRGLLANPGLVNEIKNYIRVDKNVLKEFHDNVYSGYKKILFGDKNILFRMKEIWFYMINMFTDNEKYAKKIRKSVGLSDYEAAVSNLFSEQNLISTQ
ncbi:MAG TPA: tRNA-dihydrouridine synthase, partial [Clostridia bacterium]|nr:tRNA-dihydrouridine synthase [Clostridia bacterium]